MRIGVPKEIKNNENRVAMTPAGVFNLVKQGHEIVVECGAGVGSSFPDEEYVAAGALMEADVAQVWRSDMVMKVKEPLLEEYERFSEGLILFTYLHLAAEPELTAALLEKGVTAVAYETMVGADGSLPLLTPMSEVAGRMAAQVGAQFLEKPRSGKGILLSGVPGVERGKVAIIGGGVAGANAAKIAIGLGANVTILDISAKRLAQLDDIFGNAIQTLVSSPYTIAEVVKEADLVIGAVLIPGAKAPKLVTEAMVKTMKPGAVLVDIAVDQGGIFATTDKVTTHDDPVYAKFGVVHYAVANMPGAVPRTSTLALTNVTIPYAAQIANLGIEAAALANPTILTGINTYRKQITMEAVAKGQSQSYTPISEVIA
ncbi:alanine dehydrogenase [Listeria newyorkensis]|uniref:Alanine dehydrogenase n=1 Tax=Listeria newyorkensis TaxID=1497681 RepID=A0ABX4XJF6_9LIST|nr:alanine dehydrogenase [Listeria newyorkensis]KGL45662.1 alanine dehydrogenase [Listeria newyorkensis]KMT62796.1 alanine dehydrogenase [Listeria newyorkensis]PNP88251.1 alanine dehydrogenase [Listeria newyorkensis]WAO20751.1 alanine dehydrogenase [Listeria newyorkensis]SQC55189.1 Alanine dehydrogenase [Listeria newyorkensis]